MQGFTIWFSGLSGSGKSTIAEELQKQLEEKGCSSIEVLDGDEIRKELNYDLGFSKEDRLTNLKRVAFLTKLLSRNGVIAIVAFISPYQSARDYARELNTNFLEVYINCPLKVCEDRDVKGLYKKARDGDLRGFTGIDDPFDEPLSPDVSVRTDLSNPQECAKMIIKAAQKKGFISFC